MCYTNAHAFAFNERLARLSAHIFCVYIYTHITRCVCVRVCAVEYNAMCSMLCVCVCAHCLTTHTHTRISSVTSRRAEAHAIRVSAEKWRIYPVRTEMMTMMMKIHKLYSHTCTHHSAVDAHKPPSPPHPLPPPPLIGVFEMR